MTLTTLLSEHDGVFSPPSAGPYSPPLGVADDYLASLPFPEAQKALAAGVTVDAFSTMPTLLDWHGSTLTTNINYSTALVRTGGPLEDLIGERILIRSNLGGIGRLVYAWVEGSSPALLEDLSVTRRLMLSLALLSADHTRVLVGVLT